MFRNRRVVLFCDNEAVVHMINKSSSKCWNCVVLIRLLGLLRNVRIFAKWVSTKDNGKAYALSRGDFKRFWSLGSDSMNKTQTPIPHQIWPMCKLWLH